MLGLARGGHERLAEKDGDEILLARALWLRVSGGYPEYGVEDDPVHVREVAYQDRDQLTCGRLPHPPVHANTAATEEVPGRSGGCEEGEDLSAGLPGKGQHLQSVPLPARDEVPRPRRTFAGPRL